MKTCFKGSTPRRTLSPNPEDLADLSVQPFPAQGDLADNLNKSLAELRDAIPATLQQSPVFVYIVTTVKVEDREFMQTGCGPNFQGGYISLCTCKHQSRASAPRKDCRGPDPADPWKGVWVAGLCSPSESRPRGLFYLMLVEQTFASHAECWNGLSRPLAKSAFRNSFGDIYEPISGAKGDSWSERSYKPHLRGHRHRPAVRKYDIENSFYGRHPQLLIGEPRRSYLWSEPQVKLTLAADRNWKTARHRFYPQLNDLLLMLR